MVTAAAQNYLARLKARTGENANPSNPQNLQKPATSPFEPFEGRQGDRFSGQGLSAPVVAPAMAQEFRNTLKGGPPVVAGECEGEPVTPVAMLRGEYEERAAILEYDAGLPRAWAEHFARLIVGETPGDFSPTRWQSALDGALTFADKWGREADRLGWDASEVFGLDEAAPAARIDRRGLAWLLGDGSEVVAMDRSGAEIRTLGGGRKRFYRLPARLRT